MEIESTGTARLHRIEAGIRPTEAQEAAIEAADFRPDEVAANHDRQRFSRQFQTGWGQQR